MKTLVLPLKKKWFDMIKSGEKLEEYREIKPYYQKKFCFYKSRPPLHHSGNNEKMEIHNKTK